MANNKKYAYYNKGNKVAIIEQADTTSSGRLAVAHCTISGNDNKTDCEAAGGVWIPGSAGNIDSYGEYKSPVESIDNGLEIEYTYSPVYTVTGNPVLGANKFHFPFWTVIDGYLCFITLPAAAGSALVDLTASAYNTITTGTQEADVGRDYILVEGSGIWDGPHIVQTNNIHAGVLKTYTKVTYSVPYNSGAALDFTATGGRFYDGSAVAPDEGIGTNFDAGDSIYIGGSATEGNNGMWKVNTVISDHAIMTNNYITILEQYLKVNMGNTTLNLSTAAVVTEVDQTDIFYMKSFKIENCTITTNIDYLNDEDFELDLTRKQANALVYYLRARMSEDIGELKMREYYMRLFNKALEESSSSRKYGPHMIQGFSGMRK